MNGPSPRTTTSVIATAHANIALVKYWGKLPGDENLPAVPSLSLTLDALSTRTSVRFDHTLPADSIEYNGAAPKDREATRMIRLLDEVREASGLRERAQVRTQNDFPTASGLASSASGFAALALAATRAAGLDWPLDRVSNLARRASASAARSLFGGFVTLSAGTPGSRFLAAEPLITPDSWDISLTVAVLASGPKSVGSTEAMRRTAASSPYYAAWVEDAPRLFERARTAVFARDLEALGTVAEASAFAMHASAMAARPPIVYFNPATLVVVDRVRLLRNEGVHAYVTMDAGPHVKVLSLRSDAERVASALQDTGVVLQIIAARPGPAAAWENEAP